MRALLCLALCAAPAATARAQTVIKFATLAPAGTSWMKVMAELDKELQTKTSGRLKFKFYPGGVQGDEKDVVRKIRLGQLHSAGITGVGLGEIAPEVRVLDSPFLFREAGEVDHVLQEFTPELERALEAKGFILLGWTEVGFVHVYTASPVRAPEDMKPLKMWVWEGDPIAEAAYKAFGVQPRPLALPDVMTSLQTGLINGVYTSHMAAVGLQWFTKTKFILSVPIAYSAGAVVVSKKLFDSLPEEDRKSLREVGRKNLEHLTQVGRQENKDALVTLQKQGLKVSDAASPEEMKRYEEAGRKARRELVGRLYSADLLDRVERSVEDVRAGRSKGAGEKPAGDSPKPAPRPAPPSGKIKPN